VDAPDRLVWDGGNRGHLADRNAQRVAAGEAPISEQECDGLYESADWTFRDREYLDRSGEWVVQRHLIGRTPAGRALTLACDVTEDGYRPATVWPSSTEEQALYREWKDGQEA
jgi:hypothetical protein